MTQGFVQVAPDSTGKQLDNDVVVIPAGTILSDGAGNLTTLANPAYYFRERVVNADPANPVGLATVTNAAGPNPNDFGLTVRLPQGQADLQTIAALLLDIDTNISALLTSVGQGNAAGDYLFPVAGMPASVQSPGVARQQICDIFGRAIVVPHATREAVQTTQLTITSTTSAQTLIAAPDANTYNDLVVLTAANTSATATELDISDGTQTIALYLPAGDMRGLALGGVIIKASATGAAWTATTLTSVASVKIWVMYVQNKAK